MSAPQTSAGAARPVPVEPRRSPVPTGLLVAAAIVCGSLVSLQSRINGGLGAQLDDTLLAAVISFGGGLVLMLAIVACRSHARGALRLLSDVPWPTRLGGLSGALLVVTSAAAAPVIGVALLTVGLVAGQVTGGLAVDRSPLSPVGRQSLAGVRLASAVLCLVAVGISAVGRGAREASPVLLLLVVLAGALLSVQQALNGRVRHTTNDASVATLLNFVVGTTALCAGLLVHAVLQGVQVADWPGPDQWYLYLGGPLGAIFVAVAALVVRRLGVLRLGLALISGQLIGGLLLDVVVPVHAVGIGPLTLLAVALTLVAVALSSRGPR